MRSMTGYGRGEVSRSGCKITVELSSVNRKQGDIALALPRELDPLEPRVREAINQQVSRGRLNARVTLHLGEGAWGNRAQVNVPLARLYAREFRRVSRELGLEGGVALDMVLRAPGVLQPEGVEATAETFWPLLQKALARALAALVRMREREGKHLFQDLRKRVAALRVATDRVRRVAPSVQQNYRNQLRERIRNAGLDLPSAEDDRLLKELVWFADRSDISEELTRLESHFVQFEDCVTAEGPVGRTLDFLAQEMNREVNTIGSKANDARVSREVVVMKTELEKFREQVQNVE